MAATATSLSTAVANARRRWGDSGIVALAEEGARVRARTNRAACGCTLRRRYCKNVHDSWGRSDVRGSTASSKPSGRRNVAPGSTPTCRRHTTPNITPWRETVRRGWLHPQQHSQTTPNKEAMKRSTHNIQNITHEHTKQGICVNVGVQNPAQRPPGLWVRQLRLWCHTDTHCVMWHGPSCRSLCH